MISNLKYVTDEFLDVFKTNFKSDYLPLYKSKNSDKILEIFSNQNNVLTSSTTFNFRPLKLESENKNAVKENVRILWDSLKHISISEAESEKMWVAILNTYYLEYHLDQLSSLPDKGLDQSIESRTIFTQGSKRSLAINNLSLLWWLAYYTIDDENTENPFHLTDFFVEGSYRGNAMIWFSSNIISNKNIALGILDAIKELVETNQMILNRYSFANSNKILNQIGGVRILDILSREEVKNIILDNLLESEKIRIPTGATEIPVSN